MLAPPEPAAGPGAVRAAPGVAELLRSRPLSEYRDYGFPSRSPASAEDGARVGTASPPGLVTAAAVGAGGQGGAARRPLLPWRQKRRSALVERAAGRQLLPLLVTPAS